MPVKAVVSGIILIIMTILLVYMVEFFLPLSMKAELDMACRSMLLRMENAGGMSGALREELHQSLEEKGLTDISISAASNARQGGMLTLHVEADYTFKKLTSLFNREEVKLRLVYKKASMSRRVVN